MVLLDMVLLEVFSLNACDADQFYITALVWTREIFPMKLKAHVEIFDKSERLYSESRNSFSRKFSRTIILSYCEKRNVNYYVCMKKKKEVNTL